VSNARDDFPEPDGPVMTISALRGMSRLIPFRLCWRTPRSTIAFFFFDALFGADPAVVDLAT
jgi:hypothetical protein